MNYLKDITFCIKTFKRPGAVSQLIGSILYYYPEASILVVDDSGDKCNTPVKNNFPSVKWIDESLDIGLSKGRNLLVNNVTTPLVVLMDDDYIFHENLDIEYVYNKLYSLDLDLLAGTVSDIAGNGVVVPRNYHGVLDKQDNILHVTKPSSRGDWDEEVMKIDFAMNWFLAKTDTLKHIGWDKSLKICEHLEWYLRYSRVYKCGKFKLPHFNVAHDPHTHSNPEYKSFRLDRKRINQMYELERKAMGVDEIWFNGKFHH